MRLDGCLVVGVFFGSAMEQIVPSTDLSYWAAVESSRGGGGSDEKEAAF